MEVGIALIPESMNLVEGKDSPPQVEMYTELLLLKAEGLDIDGEKVLIQKNQLKTYLKL